MEDGETEAHREKTELLVAELVLWPLNPAGDSEKHVGHLFRSELPPGLAV